MLLAYLIIRLIDRYLLYNINISEWYIQFIYSLTLLEKYIIIIMNIIFYILNIIFYLFLILICENNICILNIIFNSFLTIEYNIQ